MAVVNDEMRVLPTTMMRADDAMIQIDALALPPDVVRSTIATWREGVHIKHLIIQKRRVVGMTAVNNHVALAVFDVQALAGILRPSNPATASVALHPLEVEVLILWVVTRPNLDFVKVFLAATSNIHTCVSVACPADLEA